MKKNFFLSVALLATSSIGQLVPGVYNPQVSVLQALLNKNPATAVAVRGPGSAGQETDFFGPETFAALKRFQALYANDILAPWGLTAPTGFLGPLTLEKLNAIAYQTISPITITNVSSDPLAPYRVATGTVDIYSTDRKIIQIQNTIYTAVNTALTAHQAPQIDTLSLPGLTGSVLLTKVNNQAASAGATIIVAAQNLDLGPNNNVYFTADPGGVAETTGVVNKAMPTFVIKNLNSFSDTLSFTLPNFPAGRYDIAVGNSHGISNTTFFVVTTSISPTVSMTSLSSSSVRWGGMITIYGSGFTKTGNEVFTTFDTIPEVASPDGHSLTVQIAPEQMKGEAALGSGAISVPDTITVVNDNGYTITPESFSVKI